MSMVSVSLGPHDNKPRAPVRVAQVALLAALLVLSACGGGGDDAPAPVAPPPAPLPRQASGDSPVAAGCTGGSNSGTLYANAEVEAWAAADPTQPSRLLAAWQQDRWSNGGARALVSALSSDGGATWQRTLQPFSRCGGATVGSPGDFERATDPWVDFMPDGTALLMGLAFNGSALADGSASAMLAARSTDGGRTWSAPAVLVRDGATRFNDKNALTADPTANGFVYAVWDRLERDGAGPTLLARSTDGGLNWEAARVIYAPSVAGGVSQTIGNRVVVLTAGAERGVLVNFFTQIDTVGGGSTARLAVIRSTDRGLNWSAPVFLATMQGVGTPGVRDGGISGSIAAGPDNTLWAVWQDARFSAGARDAIALSRSSDGGLSWSTPLAINRVATAAAFTPVVAVRGDGLVAVLHNDLRDDTADPATLLTGSWLLTSRDGATWAEARVAGPFDIALAPQAGGFFVGDYQGLVGTANAFVPVLVATTGLAGDRTNVFAPLVDRPAGAFAVHGSRPALAGLPGAMSSEAIARRMDARLPGWRARVQEASREQAYNSRARLTAW